MDADLKTKWIAALRSGAYTQGKFAMRREIMDGVKHCCLGVLAEVAGIGLDISQYGANQTAYEAVAKVLGGSEHPLRVFTCMNDDDGKTFAEIADYVEKNL